MIRKVLLVAAAAAMVLTGAVAPVSADSARDQIFIVGSSTVYPFATVVAEQFGNTTSFKTPKIESTGSGGGLKLFCAGVGVEHPDITNASRRIKKSECDTCAKNGITDIIEMKIGYDGIVIANSKESAQMKLSRKDLFMALARQIPDASGKLIDNPNKTWKDVNPSLPNNPIEVYGPPPTSGTRDAFAELAMEAGAKKIADLKTLRGIKKGDPKLVEMMTKLGMKDPKKMIAVFTEKKGKAPKGKDIFKSVAHSVREDGAYKEAGENDVLIVKKLTGNPNSLGIFGFSFLDQNADKIQGSVVDGIAPSFDAIADGKYPVSRPLFFYVKKAHVDKIGGIREYLKEFTSEKAWGGEGYLSEKGMIPMPEAERAEFAAAAKNLTNLSCGDL